MQENTIIQKNLFAIGNSNEPGTQTISTWLLNSEVSKPCLFKQSRQPDRILLVIKSLNLAITIPTFKVEAVVKEPSKIAIKFYLDILIDSHEKVLSSN